MDNNKLQLKWGQEVGVDTVAIEPGQILLTKDKGKLYIDVPGDAEGQENYRVRVNAFHADTASQADNALNANKANIAEAVSGSLTFDFGGRKDSITYNGSTTTTINWESLGLAPALHFLGVMAKGAILTSDSAQVLLVVGVNEDTDEEITKTETALLGDVVIYGQKEYVWTDTQWVELGDESSYALKSTVIRGEDHIEVSGSLYNTDNTGIVIKHQKPAAYDTITNEDIIINAYDNVAKEFVVQTVDKDIYGHITGVTEQPVKIQLPQLQTLTINQNDPKSNVLNLTYNPSNTSGAALSLNNMSADAIGNEGEIVFVHGGLVPSSTNNVPTKSALLADGTWGQPDIFWGTF